MHMILQIEDVNDDFPLDPMTKLYRTIPMLPTDVVNADKSEAILVQGRRRTQFPSEEEIMVLYRPVPCKKNI